MLQPNLTESPTKSEDITDTTTEGVTDTITDVTDTITDVTDTITDVTDTTTDVTDTTTDVTDTTTEDAKEDGSRSSEEILDDGHLVR